MSAIVHEGQKRERATCSLCSKRRMCRIVAIWGIPGILWFVCSDHDDWEPVEGRDYTVVDSPDVGVFS